MEKIQLSKHELCKLFIDDNLTQKEIAEVFNCSVSKIQKALKQYGIKKEKPKVSEARERQNIKKYGTPYPISNDDVKEKIKKTNLKRYGVENPFASLEVQEQIKKTNLERYGTENPSSSEIVKEKRAQTNLDRFGVLTPFESEEISSKIEETNIRLYGVKYPAAIEQVREKIIQTNIKRYGSSCALSNDVIKSKIKETNLKRHGVEFVSQSEMFKKTLTDKCLSQHGVKHHLLREDVRKKIRESKVESGAVTLLYDKSINEWAMEYDIPIVSLYEYVRDREVSKEDLIKYLETYERKNTDIEKIFADQFLIEKWNKKPSDNIGYRPDFKLSDKIYVNVDGLYWHSAAKQPDSNYHFNMRKTYENNGLRIIQIRSNEIFDPIKLNIIKSMISHATNNSYYIIGARKAKIVTLSQRDAAVFLKANHIKGEKSARHIGLIVNNEIISIMSYRIYDKILKIERFCSKVFYSVPGAFSKLIKHILKNADEIKETHYWVDLRYGTGNFLLNHNFTIQNETLGWEWTDGKFETFNRLKCRANMDNRRLSQEEHAEELGWCKIYDAGQRLYLRKEHG